MFALAPTLTTDRLTLRMPVASDFAPLRDVFMSDRARFMDGPLELHGAWKEFTMDVAGWALNGCGGWSVINRETGVYRGAVALTVRPDFPEREIGWLVVPEAEGHGIAFEAASAVMRFAFHTLGWTSLVSYIDDDNDRSIRLAERLGGQRDNVALRPSPGDLVYRYMAEAA